MSTEKHFVPDHHAYLPEKLRNMVQESIEEDTIYGPDNFPVSRVDMESAEEIEGIDEIRKIDKKNKKR
jgi:hypothetical protein